MSLLISVRDDLAQKIVQGDKPWELRKSAPKQEADFVIIYAKKPTGLIIGYAKVLKIQRWEKRGNGYFDLLGFAKIRVSELLTKVSIDETELNQYLGDKKEGGIIVLNYPVAIAPAELPFHPPQGWRYFNGHPEEVIQGWRWEALPRSCTILTKT
jgi:predicted transcriptional regulator